MSSFRRFFALLAFALTTVALPVPATADTDHTGHTDAPAGAVTAEASGPWSARATWGGPPPAAGQKVVVPRGVTVVLDVSPPALGGVQVDGTLRFARRRLTLTTAYVMVHGLLQVGTVQRPFRQRATIVLDGPEHLDVHGMGTSVLGVMGGRLELHGRFRPVTWTRLAASARPGDRTIRVRDARGWRRGDQIVVASTDYDPDHAEQRRITAVDGRRVRLDAPLAHHHHGRSERIAGRRVAQRAEVGLLTRNVVVRGGPHAAHTRQGGHVMVHEGSRARIDGVELVNMGQSGVLARYPVHFHHGGRQSDSWLRRSAVHHSFNRCVTVHDSRGVRISRNVAYDTFGHCFFVEDGVETDNHFVRNLGLSTRVPPRGAALLDSDHHPATFWLSHPGNHLRGNAAAGSDGSGFWYDLPEAGSAASDGQDVDPREAAFGSFVGNVAHSNRDVGRFRSGSGLLVEDYDPPATAVFSDFVGYANTSFGVWAEGITVTGATLTGNGVGFLGRDATLNHSLVVGTSSNPAERLYSLIGAGFYHDDAEVRDVTFANFKPHEWRHGVAIGSLVEHVMQLPRISRVRFVNADRARVPAPWRDGEPVGVGFVDADGSVMGTGRASTVVGANPLIHTAGCRRAEAVTGYVCPTGLRVGFARMLDESGATADLGPVRVRRDDGAAAPAFSDPDWSDQPLSGTSVLMDHRYDFRPARTPRTLQWVFANSQRGWVELTVPWPHGTPYVYEGWGEWAQPLQRADTQAELAAGGHYRLVDGVLHVRFAGSDQWRWQQQMVCAERGCGEGMGSERE